MNNKYFSVRTDSTHSGAFYIFRLVQTLCEQFFISLHLRLHFLAHWVEIWRKIIKTINNSFLVELQKFRERKSWKQDFLSPLKNKSENLTVDIFQSRRSRSFKQKAQEKDSKEEWKVKSLKIKSLKNNPKIIFGEAYQRKEKSCWKINFCLFGVWSEKEKHFRHFPWYLLG